MRATRKRTDPPLPADDGEPAAEPAVEMNERDLEQRIQGVDVLAAAAEKEEAKAEEDNDEEDDEEEEEEEEEEDVAPPKLAEGFYVIEAIRKKRVRDRQLQYFVKWGDWPESANTWEPAENLKDCTDIIEAFEERLRAPRSSRKRRRRQSGTYAASKKKASGASTKPRVVTDVEEGEHEGKELEDEKKMTEPAEGNGTPTKDAPQEAEKTAPITDPTIKIVLTGERGEEGSMDGSCKVPLEGSGLFRGARKRKSGSIRRFKQDPAPSNHDGDQGAAVKPENGSCSKGDRPGGEDVYSTEDETGEKVKVDGSGDPSTIVKIIMPTDFAASVINNVQEVSITFKVLRSDGKEVIVNDKQLKATNPLLLIGYYEQHIFYSPA